MNNYAEIRARRNRSTALILTALLHIALIGAIYFYKSGKQEFSKEDSALRKKEATTKTAANGTHFYTKP